MRAHILLLMRALSFPPHLFFPFLHVHAFLDLRVPAVLYLLPFPSFLSLRVPTFPFPSLPDLGARVLSRSVAPSL